MNGNKITVKVADRTPAANSATASSEDKVSDEDLAQAAQWIENADKTTALADAKAIEAKANENKKETEIPVLAAKTSDASAKQSSSTSRVILSLGLVLGLLFGFSVFLKKFLRKSPLKKNSQIKVLTQHYLGPKKSLAIIRVAGESMLIGVTDNNINLIKTLALLDEEIPESIQPRDFAKSLDQSMSGADDEVEEFSISKIKDFVSGRLKNMKEL